MNGMVTIGAMTIPVDTAYKAAVIGLLTANFVALCSIIHWLLT